MSQNTPTSPDTETVAAFMVAEADRWFYAERAVCGHPDHDKPDFRCVRLVGHEGSHDPFWEATWPERIDAWLVERAASPAPQRDGIPTFIPDGGFNADGTPLTDTIAEALAMPAPQQDRSATA